MASFKTHRRFNYILFIAGCLILNHFKQFNIYVMTVFAIGFIIGTEFITPDLDGKSTPSQRLGILWLPYRVLRKHRGVSHNYIIGFVERIVYLFILISAIILLVKSDAYILFLNFLINPAIIAVILVTIAGVAIANGMHILLDKMTNRGVKG